MGDSKSPARKGLRVRISPPLPTLGTTMRPFIISLFVSLISCGEMDFQCEREIAGACFDGNGWEWNADMVNLAFSYTESYISDYYCPTCEIKTEDEINLRNMARDKELKVQFQGHLSNKECELSEPFSCLGYYMDNFIAISKAQYEDYKYEEADVKACMKDYPILSHELLHFVASVWLNDDKRSRRHSVEHFWEGYALMDVDRESVEYKARKNIEEACVYYYGDTNE